jgi:hypothetical protein
VTVAPSTFEYFKPTEKQLEDMAIVRSKFMELTFGIDGFIPEGPDKTYLIRKLRECAMWANVAITRLPDGTPRN